MLAVGKRQPNGVYPFCLEGRDTVLHHTLPDTPGKAAVLARARHLTEFCWTPVRDVPSYTKAEGPIVLKAGEPQRGMIYSSNEPGDKFLWESISLVDFLSVIANPNSALYNKTIQNGDGKSRAYFGVVCNGLVRYALNIRRRYSTRRWLAIPGIRLVYEKGTYTAADLQLCDVLFSHDPGVCSHVAMITDLLRDETGQVVAIEVSEAVRPCCRRATYDLETYFTKYAPYAITRYDGIEQVENDLETERILLGAADWNRLPRVAVDYGNNANYLSREEVVLSVFGEGDHRVEITRNGAAYEELTCCGESCFRKRFPCGVYVATHGTTGESVRFIVNEPRLSHRVEDGVLHVETADEYSRILYVDFRVRENGALSRVEELSEEEKRTGRIERPIPEEAGWFKVYFENENGVWSTGFNRL